jgi:hypothetical protein
VGRRHASEQNFPADSDEVDEGLAAGHVVDLTIFLLSGVQHNSVFELLAPSDLFLSGNFFE